MPNKFQWITDSLLKDILFTNRYVNDFSITSKISKKTQCSLIESLRVTWKQKSGGEVKKNTFKIYISKDWGSNFKKK